MPLGDRPPELVLVVVEAAATNPLVVDEELAVELPEFEVNGKGAVDVIKTVVALVGVCVRMLVTTFGAVVVGGVVVIV